MKSTSPQIENLKRMIVLEERRSSLQGQLAEVDSQLDSLRGRLVSGSPIKSSKAASSKAASSPEAPKAEAKSGRGRKRGRKAGRGELKSQIFSALEKAGSSGVKVMDLARSLGSKPANIYAWFHAAVKRYPTIKKTGNAQYRLVGSAPAPKAAAVAKPGRKPGRPAKSTSAATTKTKGARRGGRRGALKDKIIGALKQAGSSGVRIKDLSKDLKVPNRNLQVWFATTGKKTPGIKKIAPGTFKMS
jgi:hypothetical protein